MVPRHKRLAPDAKNRPRDAVDATSGISGPLTPSRDPAEWRIRSAFAGVASLWHTRCITRVRSSSMQQLSTRLFWDKKVKIALLALATFIAMC